MNAFKRFALLMLVTYLTLVAILGYVVISIMLPAIATAGGRHHIDLGIGPETRIKVAILDTGLDLSDPRFKDVLCREGHRDFTGVGLIDRMSHGTHIAGLVKRYADTEGYCLMILKITAGGNYGIEPELLALQFAIKSGVKFINMSVAGEGFSEEERLLLRNAVINKGITVVVAAGNSGRNIDIPTQETYPANYNIPGMYVVGNNKKDGGRAPTSNYGTKVNVWVVGENVISTVPGLTEEAMSGTSMSAAIQTGLLVHKYLE